MREHFKRRKQPLDAGGTESFWVISSWGGLRPAVDVYGLMDGIVVKYILDISGLFKVH